MANRFEIDGILPKQYEKEIAGGDMESISERKSKAAAFNLARREWLKPKYWEVQVKEFDKDQELINHWYFKKGLITTTMF